MMTELEKKEALLKLIQDMDVADVMEVINGGYVGVYEVAKEVGLAPKTIYANKYYQKFIEIRNGKKVIHRSNIPKIAMRAQHVHILLNLDEGGAKADDK